MGWTLAWGHGSESEKVGDVTQKPSVGLESDWMWGEGIQRESPAVELPGMVL